jgi:hypothetical protein
MPSQKYINGIQSPGAPKAGKAKVPMLFQVISPDGYTPLIPEALFLHVNPRNMSLGYAKLVDRTQTRGGFIEQHWGDALTTLSLNSATGAFLNVDQGLATTKRQETVAYDKMMDFIDLYRSNGAVFNDRGAVVFRGTIRLTFQGGVFLGHFTNLTVTEAAETPFMFNLDIGFTIEREVHHVFF